MAYTWCVHVLGGQTLVARAEGVVKQDERRATDVRVVCAASGRVCVCVRADSRTCVRVYVQTVGHVCVCRQSALRVVCV